MTIAAKATPSALMKSPFYLFLNQPKLRPTAYTDTAGLVFYRARRQPKGIVAIAAKKALREKSNLLKGFNLIWVVQSSSQI